MKDDLSIIYDGECPFCRSFVSSRALFNKFNVKLINAREINFEDPDLAKISHINLDETMVILHGSEVLTFEEAYCFLSKYRISKYVPIISKAICRSPPIIRSIVYRLLVKSRTIFLKISGIGMINERR